MHPDSYSQILRRPHEEGSVFGFDQLLDLQGAADGGNGVVFLRLHRDTPGGHNRVTDKLIDVTPVPDDDFHRFGEVGVENLDNLLRLLVFAKGGISPNIGEEDGGYLLVASELHHVGCLDETVDDFLGEVSGEHVLDDPPLLLHDVDLFLELPLPALVGKQEGKTFELPPLPLQRRDVQREIHLLLSPVDSLYPENFALRAKGAGDTPHDRRGNAPLEEILDLDAYIVLRKPEALGGDVVKVVDLAVKVRRNEEVCHRREDVLLVALEGLDLPELRLELVEELGVVKHSRGELGKGVEKGEALPTEKRILPTVQDQYPDFRGRRVEGQGDGAVHPVVQEDLREKGLPPPENHECLPGILEEIYELAPPFDLFGNVVASPAVEKLEGGWGIVVVEVEAG